MKEVIKDYTHKKLDEHLMGLPVSSKFLIVFWHGLGDLLMFEPIYNAMKKHYCSQFSFDLCVQPGVGQTEAVRGAIERTEDHFLDGYDMAFVINFPMSEGSNLTKAEKCLRDEIGLDLDLETYPPIPSKNILVGVHFQGTCLPGSTNPDPILAKQIWDDILELGYVPFDLHFQHVFHNPANMPFPFAGRQCRDLKPSIKTLRDLIGSCGAFVGVASGPFVLALSLMPEKVIFLQLKHDVHCYTRNFNNVINLCEYNSTIFKGMLANIMRGG